MRKIFVNLPVKDLDAAKGFFEALGFAFNPQFTDTTAACMVVSDAIYVMLLTEPRFRDFINDDIVDTSKAREVLTCLSVETRAEIDTILEKALATGAKPWKPNQDHGWMYGCSFQDLDGHVWEFVWMSEAAAAQQG